MMMCRITEDQFKCLEKAIASLGPIAKDAASVLASLKAEDAEQREGFPKEVRDFAMERMNRDGSAEIDSDAIVSVGDDDGAYIMSWVWVDGEALREHSGEASCDECGGPIEGSPEDDDDVEQLCEECQKEKP